MIVDVESGKSVLYFTMANCGACKHIKPFWDTYSQTYSPYGIKFYKLDVEDNAEMAVKLNIMSFPTFIFINKGSILGKQEGANDNKLLSNIKSLLSS